MGFATLYPSYMSSHNDIEWHAECSGDGFQRTGGAGLLAGFDVGNITLAQTGPFGHFDLGEPTVFAYRANRVLAALDRGPHRSRQRDVFAPGDLRVGRIDDACRHRVLARRDRKSVV